MVVWRFESVHGLSLAAFEDDRGSLCRQWGLDELSPSSVSPIETGSQKDHEHAGDCRDDGYYDFHRRNGLIRLCT